MPADTPSTNGDLHTHSSHVGPAASNRPAASLSAREADSTPSLAPSPHSSRNSSPQRPSVRRPAQQNPSTVDVANNARSPTRASSSTTNGVPALQRAMTSPIPDLQPKLSPRPKQPINPVALEGNATTTTTQKTAVQSDQQAASLIGQGPSKLPRASSNLSSKLETVVEGDLSTSPSDASNVLEQAKEPTTPKQAQPQQPTKLSSVSEAADDGPVLRLPQAALRHDGQRNTTAPAALPKRKTSHSSLASAKMRGGTNDTSSQNMTVETETVASIPQTSTAPPTKQAADSSRNENNGTVKLRTSNETIRPKKEKKRVKKAPSIISGTGPSTKADIFEAKVASEIEGDDTDSDETFVYESNPPERRARQSKNHSRTPSATSLHSIGERRNGNRTGSLLDSHRVRAKRSMKFASSSYAGSSVDDDPSERDANSQTPNRKQPQHIGMFGRSHASQGHDQDSPFSAASKLRITTRPTSNNSSRHHSPRSDRAESKVPRKGESFDFDNAPDDDEQTPLMGGSLRTPRTRGSRRPVSSGLRQQMEYYDDPRRSCLGRLAGGMVMFVMVVLTLLGVSGFFFATTKPMSDVHIQQIQNVLASEAEIMLDLKVEAVNTNFGGIAVTSVDLNIFAKSRHVGDPKHHNHTKDPHDVSAWRRHRPQRIGIRDDDPSDPQPGDGDGLDGDPQTMLLGRILHLDSALIFEGSPLRHLAHNATGELRLEKPGSKTDDDGRERWEHVVQHPFELIVRGVLKYQLPLNSRILTASVGAGVLVHPEDSDAKGAMRVEPVPRWFIWKDLQEVTPADAEAAND